MGTVEVHPSTLEGIKRLAKSIKREQSISHALSLDHAARAARYQNFKHARRMLAAHSGATGAGAASRRGSNAERHTISCFITAYWWDVDADSRGRETLRLEFDKPLTDIVSANVVRAGVLGKFKLDAIDHLEAIGPTKDAEAAREAVCKIARKIQFLAVTGLTVRRGRVTQHSLERLMRGMPGADHTSIWIDPATGTEVACDEPYSGDLLGERREWLASKGLHVVMPTWAGMYFPYNATPYLVSGDRALLDRVAAQLESSNTVYARDDEWPGDSGPFEPPFVSPARKASGTAKRPMKKPIVVGGEIRNGATPYSRMPFGGVAWRPVARLPLKAHIEIASLLKPLVTAYPPLVPAAVSSRLTRVRCELDDWVQREYKHDEMPDELFHRLYYGEDGRALPEPYTTPAAAIARTKALLAQYNDCAPARALRRAMDVAERHLPKE